jgi:hypothetical protein
MTTSLLHIWKEQQFLDQGVWKRLSKVDNIAHARPKHVFTRINKNELQTKRIYMLCSQFK